MLVCRSGQPQAYPRHVGIAIGDVIRKLIPQGGGHVESVVDVVERSIGCIGRGISQSVQAFPSVTRSTHSALNVDLTVLIAPVDPVVRGVKV